MVAPCEPLSGVTGVTCDDARWAIRSNVVDDIIASRSRGETRIDRANNYGRQEAYADAVANLAALPAHQATTERAELDQLMRMANSRAQPLKPPSAEFLARQKRFESKP